jgi:hypothetical protein
MTIEHNQLHTQSQVTTVLPYSLLLFQCHILQTMTNLQSYIFFFQIYTLDLTCMRYSLFTNKKN